MRSPAPVAVVTGASSGIGAAVARRLAVEGMTVVAVARRTERLDALARQDGRIEAYPANVARRADMAALASAVEQRHGRLDVLVNNAGVPGERFRDWSDLDDVVRTMQVNFMGAVHTMAAFGDLLRSSTPSQVINVASVSGKIGTGPAGYVASKFALVGFSEAVGLDWARDGVTVTQLNPGFVATEGFPQTRLVQSRWARLVTTPEVVADSVVDALHRRVRERTVPRWYRPLVVLRHVAAPIFWALTSRTARSTGAR